jgi:hypothetical protein
MNSHAQQDDQHDDYHRRARAGSNHEKELAFLPPGWGGSGRDGRGLKRPLLLGVGVYIGEPTSRGVERGPLRRMRAGGRRFR